MSCNVLISTETSSTGSTLGSGGPLTKSCMTTSSVSNTPYLTKASHIASSLFSGSTNVATTVPGAAQSSNSPSPSVASSNGPPSVKKSKAWIAGPVIGGIAGSAIIAGLSFWVWKLKSAQKKQQAAAVAGEKKAGMEAYPGMPQQLDSKAVHIRHEIDGSQVDGPQQLDSRRVQLPLEGPRIVELEGGRIED
jgi:hypothetical protein